MAPPPGYDAEMTLEEYNAMYGGSPAPQPTYDAVMTADEYNAMYGPKTGKALFQSLGADLTNKMTAWENRDRDKISAQALTALDIPTFGLADEATSYLGAATAKLQGMLGLGPKVDFGKTQEEYLNKARGLTKDLAKTDPGQAVGLQLVGALANAPRSAAKVIANPQSLKTAIVQGMKEGGIFGAKYGFGSGEGGVAPRIQNAIEGAAIQAPLGAVSSAATKGMSSLANKLTSTADDVEESFLGTVAADFSKSAKRSGLRDVDDQAATKLKESIKAWREEGGFKGANDIQSINTKLVNEVDELGDSLGTLLQKADEKRIAETGEKVIPEWGETSKWIRSLSSGEKKSARKALDKYKRDFLSDVDNDGSIKFLQTEKRALYDEVFGDNKDVKESLYKYVARDLKKTIEKYSDKYLPKDAAGMVKETNRRIGIREDLNPIVKRTIAKTETPFKPADLEKIMYTTGGLMAPVIGGSGLSMVTDDPRYALGGVALSAGGAALRSQAARQLIPSVFRNSAQAINKYGIPGTIGAEKFIGTSMNDKPENMQAAPTSSPKPAPTPEEVTQLIKQQDPLIRAIIAAESSGNPTAVSKTGAKGLMQLMPATAKAWGVEDPFDPIQNIEGGKKNIEAELKRFGDTRLAVAAYNLGGTKLAAIIKRLGTNDYNRISHALPEETRKYVPKIMAMYNKFNTSQG